MAETESFILKQKKKENGMMKVCCRVWWTRRRLFYSHASPNKYLELEPLGTWEP
jgi:hypothetical protein